MSLRRKQVKGRMRNRTIIQTYLGTITTRCIDSHVPVIRMTSLKDPSLLTIACFHFQPSQWACIWQNLLVLLICYSLATKCCWAYSHLFIFHLHIFFCKGSVQVVSHVYWLIFFLLSYKCSLHILDLSLEQIYVL